MRARASRAGRWGAIVAAVLLLHASALRWVEDAMVGWGTAARAPMPQRIEVAFVRELAPAVPVPQAAPAAPVPRAARPRKRAAAVAPPAASAPVPQAASAPPGDEVLARAAEPPLAEPTGSTASAPREDATPAAAPSSAPQPEAAPPRAAASAPVPGPFEWPPSTRLTYSLFGHFRGELHGNARVQWVRAGARYQVHVDVSIGPSFAPLITRRMTSDGEVGDGGLVPRRYDEATSLPFQSTRRATVTFAPDSVTLANSRVRAAPPGVQDAASQFVHLTWLFTLQPERLRVGNSVDFPLALPRRMDRWTYDVVAAQRLDTPVGALDTFHLKPRRAGERPAGELSAEMWIAPSLQNLPVRIRIEQDAETYVDLLLDAAPLQAQTEGAAPPR